MPVNPKHLGGVGLSSEKFGKIEDVNVTETKPLVSPRAFKQDLPITESIASLVRSSRETIAKIISGEDPRFLVIAGPCSIHEPAAAIEYAKRLANIRGEVSDTMFIVMRVYFEKPRTTRGWKGLINDPHMDGSYDIQTGLRTARWLLLAINGLGVPVGTEFLDPVVPQYIADLVSWAAIGARTTESQTHREMASGLSMPVGFKNGTDGNLQTAINAMISAQSPHNFLGIDQDGRISTIVAGGNRNGHAVLRGGEARPNYDETSIAGALAQLKKHGLPEVVMVDCSHANSGKKHAKQEEVWRSIIGQRTLGNTALFGGMIESHLFEGNQKFPDDPKDIAKLRYGVSVTDECISWETTERMLRFAHEEIGKSALEIADTELAETSKQ